MASLRKAAAARWQQQLAAAARGLLSCCGDGRASAAAVRRGGCGGCCCCVGCCCRGCAGCAAVLRRLPGRPVAAAADDPLRLPAAAVFGGPAARLRWLGLRRLGGGFGCVQLRRAGGSAAAAFCGGCGLARDGPAAAAAAFCGGGPAVAQQRPAAARSSSGGLVDTLTMGNVGSDDAVVGIQVFEGERPRMQQLKQANKEQTAGCGQTAGCRPR